MCIRDRAATFSDDVFYLRTVQRLFCTISVEIAWSVWYLSLIHISIPERMVRFRLLCGDFLSPNSAPYLENRKTVCMGYTAMTPKRESRKTPPEVVARFTDNILTQNARMQALVETLLRQARLENCQEVVLKMCIRDRRAVM